MIYQHRASVTAASGTVASATLKVSGGLCRQVLIRANTGSTVFRANVVDENSVTVANYDYHEGEINDVGQRPVSAVPLPMAGTYTVNITNASVNDTFTLLLAVEETPA